MTTLLSHPRPALIVPSVVLLLSTVISGQPTDNPITLRYGTSYSWTNEIRWSNVHNINSYQGATMVERFNKARDAAAATGGGVVYFPAGEYRFENTIYLRNGVVLRGETPSVTDAKNSSFQPASKLVFPQYVPTFTGTGTDIATAFKNIMVEDADNASNLGLIFLDINRAGIKINATSAAKNRNIVIYGIRNNNVAVPDPGVPAEGQAKWQRFSYRFAYNISGYSYRNFLVANNRLNDAPTDNYNQPGYILLDGTTPVVMTDGTRVPFNYTDHYAMSINHPHGDLHVDVTTHPSSFRKGIVIRDNWIHNTMRVKLICSGHGMVIKDNVFKDQANKAAWADPTGRKPVHNSATLENRAIDWAGWDVLVEGNQYEVFRHRLKEGPYYSVDGEGILIQECCGGTRVNGITIRNNTGNTYIGLYKMPIMRDVVVSGNTVTGGEIMVSAEKNGIGGWMENILVENNRASTDIRVEATLGGDKIIVRNNACTGTGSIRTTCNVTLSGNAGFTSLACATFTQTNRFPLIALLTPADDAVVPLSGISMTASASDPDGSIDSVVYYADGKRLGVTRTAPYSFSWTSPEVGPHYLTARAYDNQGAWFSAKPVYITVGGATGNRGIMQESMHDFNRASAVLNGSMLHLSTSQKSTIQMYTLQGRCIAAFEAAPGLREVDLNALSSGKGSRLIVISKNGNRQVLRWNRI